MTRHWSALGPVSPAGALSSALTGTPQLGTSASHEEGLLKNSHLALRLQVSRREEGCSEPRATLEGLGASSPTFPGTARPQDRPEPQVCSLHTPSLGTLPGHGLHPRLTDSSWLSPPDVQGESDWLPRRALNLVRAYPPYRGRLWGQPASTEPALDKGQSHMTVPKGHSQHPTEGPLPIPGHGEMRVRPIFWFMRSFHVGYKWIF